MLHDSCSCEHKLLNDCAMHTVEYSRYAHVVRVNTVWVLVRCTPLSTRVTQALFVCTLLGTGAMHTVE